jgi:hypothetical protein
MDMKYKNVLGKDFNRKEDAYKHFQEFRDEMVRTFQLGPSHIFYVKTPTIIKERLGLELKTGFLLVIVKGEFVFG